MPHSRFILSALIGSALSVHGQVAPQIPAIASALIAKTQIVSGAAQAKGAAFTAVDLYVCAATAGLVAPTDCSAAPVSLTTADKKSTSADANGNFAALLQSKFTAGQVIWMTQKATAAGAAAPIVSFSSLYTVGSSERPAITQPVKDQQNPITGSAPASTSGTPVQVQLLIKASAGAAEAPQGAPEAVGADGTLTLHESVSEGEVIRVRQIGGAGDGDVSDAVTVQAANNEREHIDFFAGTVLSQSESNFAQADTFLALNVDRALALPGLYGLSSTGEPCDPQKNSADGSKKRRCSHAPGINTFFQARLTTIPVNASTTMTSTSSGSGASNTASQPSLSSILSSQKTGHFEAGIYAPFLFGFAPGKKDAFANAGAAKPTQVFYLAPLGRFGFNTLASNTQTTTTSSTTGATTVANTTNITALGTTSPLPSAYNFFLLGGRIGTATIGSGSIRNIHYLDVGIGKFSNLENLLCKAGPNQCTVSQESRYRPYRMSFEGYYEIPTTGLIVGMSANIGAGIFDKHTNPDINNRAAGDLRFLFGYKFDVNKLFKALPMITQ